MFSLWEQWAQLKNMQRWWKGVFEAFWRADFDRERRWSHEEELEHGEFAVMQYRTPSWRCRVSIRWASSIQERQACSRKKKRHSSFSLSLFSKAYVYDGLQIDLNEFNCFLIVLSHAIYSYLIGSVFFVCCWMLTLLIGMIKKNIYKIPIRKIYRNRRFFVIWMDFCLFLFRGAMVGGRASDFSGWIGEAGKRGLERDRKKICDHQDSNPGC